MTISDVVLTVIGIAQILLSLDIIGRLGEIHDDTKK